MRKRKVPDCLGLPTNQLDEQTYFMQPLLWSHLPNMVQLECHFTQHLLYITEKLVIFGKDQHKYSMGNNSAYLNRWDLPPLQQTLNAGVLILHESINERDWL